LSKLLLVPAGGPTLEVTPERYAQNLRKIRMSGCEIFKVAVRTLTRMSAVLPGASLCPGCKALLVVPHQANLRIIVSREWRTALEF